MALVAARAVQFWALAVLFGGAGFLVALRRRTRRTIAVLRLAAFAAAVSGLVWFALVFVDVTGDVAALIDPAAWTAFCGAPFGPPWLVRLLLVVALVAVGLAPSPAPILVLGTALVLDQAWLGHAATGEGSGAATQIVFYWVHVLAGFAWVGSLIMLCVVALDEGRVPADGLALFSNAGLGIVAAIVASGLANAALRGVSLHGFGATLYGRLLMVKVILFTAMVSFALVNRVRSRADPANAALRATVGVETALGLAVLGIAALLGVTPPG